jgi:hypothetical protein
MRALLVVEMLIDVDELASAAGLVGIVSRQAYSHAVVEASSRNARKTTNAKWEVCSSLRFVHEDVLQERRSMGYGWWRSNLSLHGRLSSEGFKISTENKVLIKMTKKPANKESILKQGYRLGR